jgi:hypothetical protein
MHRKDAEKENAFALTLPRTLRLCGKLFHSLKNSTR